MNKILEKLLVKNACDGKFKNSIDVRFTKQCDNACDFCIEKNGTRAYEFNLEKLTNVTMNNDKDTVLILGGEPFLKVDDLLKYVKALKYAGKKVIITTSLPNTFNTERRKINEIMYLIDHLNVSIQSTVNYLNNSILNASSKHDRLKVVENLNKKFADKIRINLNLNKRVFTTKFDLEVSLKSLKSIGCKNIKINELQEAPEQYVSFESYGFKLKTKLKSPYSFGCQQKIEFTGEEFKGMNIVLKRSCFFVANNDNACFLDLVKLYLKRKFKIESSPTIIYESGYKTTNWIKQYMFDKQS